MTTVLRRIALGAVVQVGTRDGVVTEVVKPSRMPNTFVRGAWMPTNVTRYVIQGEGYRVLRAADRIEILLP